MPSELCRFDLQALQRFGSLRNCLSWKNSCSPAVKTKSAPQSTHFKSLSWNSICELLRPSALPHNLEVAHLCLSSPPDSSCTRVRPARTWEKMRGTASKSYAGKECASRARL